MDEQLSPASTARQDAYDGLTFLGWRWGLAAIIAGLALSFLLFGYAVIYWRNADMDFMVIYNAFAMNDGKPQYFFDHTAYLTILTVKFWFQFLHGLGLLEAWSLSSMPPASDVAAFDAAMTHAVRAGRILASPDCFGMRADLRQPDAADRARLARCTDGDRCVCVSPAEWPCILASCAVNLSPRCRSIFAAHDPHHCRPAR